MKVIDLREDQTGQWKSLLSRRYTPDAKLVTQVSTILSEVQLRGDQALVEFAQRFDHADLQPQELAVTEAEMQTALGLIKPELVDALQATHRNVRTLRYGACALIGCVEIHKELKLANASIRSGESGFMCRLGLLLWCLLLL